VSHIKEFDFRSAIPHNKGPALWLENMHKAANEIPEGVSCIKDTPKGDYRSLTAKELSRHTLVAACGHTGYTFSWTVNNLQYIYNKGWNKWLHYYDKRLYGENFS
jgi:hypothetical protein